MFQMQKCVPKCLCHQSMMEIKITTPHSQFPDYAYVRKFLQNSSIY